MEKMFLILFVLVTTVIGVIDLLKLTIPNLIVIPLLLTGFLFRFLTGHGDQALMGCLIYGSIGLAGFLPGLIGGGDVKLLAAIGAWLGVIPGLVLISLSLLIACVISLLLRLKGKKHSPYGVCVALAVWVSLIVRII